MLKTFHLVQLLSPFLKREFDIHLYLLFEEMEVPNKNKFVLMFLNWKPAFISVKSTSVLALGGVIFSSSCKFSHNCMLSHHCFSLICLFNSKIFSFCVLAYKCRSH